MSKVTLSDEELREVIEMAYDAVIDLIADKYLTYAMSDRMRRMTSTTSIINKIETQAMERLIKDIELLKES